MYIWSVKCLLLLLNSQTSLLPIFIEPNGWLIGWLKVSFYDA